MSRLSQAQEQTYIVGLTGGIGSGKSTAASKLAALGAHVVDADLISHQLTQTNGLAIPAIEAAFPGVVTNGTLNRALLRERVFKDEAAREKLEAILHPMIRAETERQLTSPAALAAPYTVLMVPLLFESTHYAARLDSAVVIDVSEATQIARVLTTRNISAETLKGIMDAQMTRDARLKHANFVVDNNGTPEDFEQHLNVLHKSLCLAASKKHASMALKP